MKDYQERVITEQKELAEKIIKLATVIMDQNKIMNISRYDLKLLKLQHEFMLDYNRILQIRINTFKGIC